MYRAHAEVIDGEQWLATLDHRTCFVCGLYDGTIWLLDKLYKLKVPFAPPNCRCVLIPTSTLVKAFLVLPKRKILTYLQRKNTKRIQTQRKSMMNYPTSIAASYAMMRCGNINPSLATLPTSR